MNRIVKIAILSLGALMLLASISYVALNWEKIPGQIPMNYSFSGEVNSYGSKNNLWVIALVSLTSYLLVGLISFFPKYWNVPKKWDYAAVHATVIIMDLIMAALLSYLLLTSAGAFAMSSAIVASFLVLMFGTVAGGFIIAAIRGRRL